MVYLESEHGGNIYEVKRQYEKDIIDFSANINPLGLPETIKNILFDNFESVIHYPDSEANELKKLLSEYWCIDSSNFLIGNGSADLIYLLMNAYSPESVIIPVPSFSEYEKAAACVTDDIKFISLDSNNSFNIDFSNLQDTDVLILGNPNNPTGNILVKDVGDILKHFKGLVIIDEAFIEWLPEQKKISFIKQAAENKKLIVLRSFTKFFALPGLRAGYLVAHSDVIRYLKKFQAPWSCNIFAQLAAKEMINNKMFINVSQKFMEEEKEYAFNQLGTLSGIKIYPSVANFFLLRILKDNISSKDIKEQLIDKGILIRDCSNFRGLDDRYIRIAVRTREENIQMINELSEILNL